MAEEQVEPTLCPNCRQQYIWQKEFAGKAARCETCGKLFRFPQTATGGLGVLLGGGRHAPPGQEDRAATGGLKKRICGHRWIDVLRVAAMSKTQSKVGESYFDGRDTAENPSMLVTETMGGIIDAWFSLNVDIHKSIRRTLDKVNLEDHPGLLRKK